MSAPNTAVSKVVQDERSDVVENIFKDKMLAGFAGRKTFQKIHVRASAKGGGKTTKKYNASRDLPSEATMTITPTTEEENGTPDDVQLLVVGLVIAENPYQYSTAGWEIRQYAREAARTARGMITAPDKVLRALAPVTDYIDSKIKYYVAINQKDGLCDLRVISVDTIFFFPEFLTSVKASQTQRERGRAIADVCKFAAANEKRLEDDAADQGDDEVENEDE